MNSMAGTELLNAINPLTEMVAYEALWQDRKTSFKTLSQLFKNPASKPSDFISIKTIEGLKPHILDILSKTRSNYMVNILIHGALDYPSKLRDAQEPIEIIYYTGQLDLLSSRSIAVVGTRNPSPEGLRRTKQLVKKLVEDGFTIVSGLAAGIDTVAHETAIKLGGKTIGVLGTPLNTFYPKENKDLQKQIAKDFLLVSQVPFYRYTQQFAGNKLFFPERNKTMSALTEGTVIIEAGETSGTLIQARAAIQQERKLFILESCFKNNNITWPAKFEKMGAIRVREYEDLKNNLNVSTSKTGKRATSLTFPFESNR